MPEQKKTESIVKKIRREIMRSLMVIQQSKAMSRSFLVFGAPEQVVYDDVEDTLNIAYVNRAEVALAMDVFKPKVPKGTELPVIIMIHGGGLFMGDREINRSYGRLLAHKGYLVFSLEYRLAPQAAIGEQLDDVCAGMDRVGEMLVNYDVNFTRIFLVADSAGSYLALYVSAMHESEKLQNIIGYKPSRMRYAAIGTICGMFYTESSLNDQIWGDRREDEKFKKYMNAEHPEIVNNLPPVFMVTSQGDIYNNYSIRYHKVLKEAGKISKLFYAGDEELQHIFPIMQPEHPKSLEATDKMLAWFEERAKLSLERKKREKRAGEKHPEIQARIADGSIGNQKVWSNLQERLSLVENGLKRIAVIDCTRQYTYGQMFAEWERYARAFSGLGIGFEANSRVALCGAVTAEPLFALEGLNMVGAEVSLFSYPDFLPNGMWKSMIEVEKITDLIITDVMVTPEVWKDIQEVKKQFGLRHVILLHSLMGGPAIGPAELVYNEYNYHMLRGKPDAVFMNDLLEKYRDTEIVYDKSKGERIAFITHTSGTTKGTRKMLPFTDKVFNDSLNMMPEGHHSLIEGPDKYKPLRIVQLFDMSSVMALAGMIHGPLVHGDTLVMTFFGFMHPKFVRAIDYYNVSVLMGTGFMYDKWLERDDLDDVDFSSLRIVSLSGGFVSPEKMEKYQKFFADHGFRYQIMNAYDMSEAGGKHIFSHPGGHPHGEGHPGGHPHAAEQAQDTLGHVEDPENYRIKDENDGKSYRLEDGPRTGLLYKYSETRPSNELDGVVLYEYTEIDGKDFLCTNDLMRVNEDGSLSFAGRADKYFVNNEGRKFDSGIVDMQMSAQSAVDRCAVVPVMDKRIHDTVPVLYVVPAEKGPQAAESIRQAFVDVYVKNKSIPAENLPSQFMIVDDIPLNPNGKLDIYRITRERLEGDAWNLIPVMDKDQLVDIRTEHREHVNSMTGGTLPHGMENNSAYNVFDFFTGGSGENADDPITKTLEFLKRKDMKPWDIFNPFMHYKLLMPDNPEEKLKMPEIPDNVRKEGLKYVNRVVGIPYGRKSIDIDFEED